MRRLGLLTIIWLVLLVSRALAVCLTVLTPPNGATFTLGSNVSVSFSDTCTNRWFECLNIDGNNANCGTPSPQVFTWATAGFSLGSHNVAVRSYTLNGTMPLGISSVNLNLITSCISFRSPQPDQAIGGDFIFATIDNCRNAWFETLFVDASFVGSFAPGRIHWNTVEWDDGPHDIEITSQSMNPGSVLLGHASERVFVQNQAPPPTPTPNATPTPVRSSCLTIISPTTNTTQRLDFALHTIDTCAGMQHEALYVDNKKVNEFIPNTEIVSSDDFPNGIHSVKVEAHLAQPADSVIGAASTTYNFQNTAPTPIPQPSGGPTPTSHFTTQPHSGRYADNSATAPSDAQCGAIIPFARATIPENQATHSDDLGLGITSAVNQTQARQSDLTRLAQFGFSYEAWSNYFWFRRITGKYTGTTWNIFRFNACKFGVDEDAIKAQATTENGSWVQWHSGGDRRTTRSECQNGDVDLFNYNCFNCCYQSCGHFQTKVFFEFMSWPMLEYSTDFSAEYYWAGVRACMNGDLTPYFNGRPEAVPYATDAANYKSNPSGASSHIFTSPLTGARVTN